MVEQHRQIGPGDIGSQTAQVGVVFRVKRHDMIEALEILRGHLPSAQAGYVDAMARGRGDGARVGWAANMPVTGPGGIDFDGQPFLLRGRPHRRLGQRRAADIAEADEQYAGRCSRRHLALMIPQARRPPALPVGSLL